MCDIASSKLIKTYVSERIAYPEGKAGNLAMVYNGYLEVPSDGVYTFSLLSDDGSILKLDDQVLIENDGLHSPAERSAQVHLLQVNINWNFLILIISAVC